MVSSDTANVLIAGAALGVSLWTAWAARRARIKDGLKADVTVYFHRNRDKASVTLPDGTIDEAGYHLVLWNRGPAVARDVTIRPRAENTDLDLLDARPGEFPLPVLDAGARYPVPWLVADPALQRQRRVSCLVTWTDGTGAKRVRHFLRRGETLQ